MDKTLVACTSSGALDYAPERYKNLDVYTLPLGLTVNGVEQKENEVDAVEFFKYLVTLKNPKDNLPRSSMITNEDVRACYDYAISNGYNKVIVVTLSSYLSGSFSLAKSVANEYADKLQVVVIDSKSCAFVEGYLAVQAKKLLNDGVDFETVVKEVEWTRDHHEFIGVDAKLDYLIYNGRLKGAKAFMGKMLNVCPLVGFDKNGVLDSIRTVRTPKKALHEMCKEILVKIGDRKPEDYLLYHIYTGEETLNELKEIEKEYGIKVNHEQVIMTPAPGTSNGPWLAGYGLTCIRRPDEPLF